MNIRNKFYSTVHGQHHHWWALGVTSTGSFMTCYDLGAVSMALPQIMTNFQGSLALTSWVILAQLLTAAALLLPAGRLGDMVGRKKVYNLGFVVFITGSFLSGVSQSLPQLILFRILQATGAAMLQTNSFAIVTAVFPERDRGKGMGSSSTVAAIGTTLGPAIGGLILGTFGWRGVFFVNVPVGIIGAFLAHVILIEKRVSTPPDKVVRQFDIAGAGLAALAIWSLLIGLSFGQQRSWSSTETVFFLGVSVAAMAVFPWFESRRTYPLVDTSLWKSRAFVFNHVARIIFFLSISANILLMPFYLQIVLGYSPFETGMLIAPMSLATGLVSPIAGALTNRISTRFLSAFGMAIMAFGTWLTTRLTLSSNYHDVLWPLIIIGAGHAIFQTPNNTSIMDTVSRDKFGLSSGLMALGREIGRTVGTALASIIVVTSMFASVGPVSLYTLKREGAAAVQGPALLAFADGITTAFVVATLLCIPGIFFVLARGKTARDEAIDGRQQAKGNRH